MHRPKGSAGVETLLFLLDNQLTSSNVTCHAKVTQVSCVEGQTEFSFTTNFERPDVQNLGYR